MKKTYLKIAGSITTMIVLSMLTFTACKKAGNDPAVSTQVEPTPSEPATTELNYSKKTSPVMFEITSTGCPGCGSWGKPTFKELVGANGSDVTPLAVHIKYGDPMITEESNAIGNNRHGQRYTPQIWVGDENAVVLNGHIVSQASKDKANRLIDSNKQLEQPSLAAVIEKDGNKWKVIYGAKFIDIAAEGEYALACFLTEDGIVAPQSSSPNPTTHNHVIRTSANGAFGMSFTNDDLIEMETKYEHTFDVSEYNSANTYITIILWKKDGNRYQPVNGFVVK